MWEKGDGGDTEASQLVGNSVYTCRWYMYMVLLSLLLHCTQLMICAQELCKHNVPVLL